MKQILAFGDSLTWGADPVTGLREFDLAPAAFGPDGDGGVGSRQCSTTGLGDDEVTEHVHRGEVYREAGDRRLHRSAVAHVELHGMDAISVCRNQRAQSLQGSLWDVARVINRRMRRAR
mgnify:CR=1 FL=1